MAFNLLSTRFTCLAIYFRTRINIKFPHLYKYSDHLVLLFFNILLTWKYELLVSGHRQYPTMQRLHNKVFFFFFFFFFCLWMWRKKIELKSPKLHTQGPPGTARAALGSMPVPPTTAKNRGILILRPMSHPTLELRHGPRWSSP